MNKTERKAMAEQLLRDALMDLVERDPAFCQKRAEEIGSLEMAVEFIQQVDSAIIEQIMELSYEDAPELRGKLTVAQHRSFFIGMLREAAKHVIGFDKLDAEIRLLIVGEVCRQMVRRNELSKEVSDLLYEQAKREFV